MPYIVTNPESGGGINLAAFDEIEDYKYKYFDKLNLHPSSELHGRLVTYIMRRAMASDILMARRREAWARINDKLTGYIELSDYEKKIKEFDPRRPVSIVFPYSYAILETLVAYMMARYSGEYLFTYEGTGPEDIVGAFLLQNLVNTHCIRNKVLLSLHTLFRDAGAYGLGVVAPKWEVQTRRRYRGKNRDAELEILYEGNALANIDPFRYLPDPNVPIHDPQKGEFVAWISSENYVDLLSLEGESDDVFNVKYLAHMQNHKSSVLASDLRQNGRRELNMTVRDTEFGPIDVINIYCKIIPRNWGLGNRDIPEKWLFSLAGDSIIIRAQPVELFHGRFPVVVAAPDFDGHSSVTFSRLEVMDGMQTVIDWLFNSHIANVRKVVNDVLIVDPFMINMKDLESPEPGGFVRLRRPAWGKGVKDAVMQLSVNDITRQNIPDVANIIDYMRTIGGTDNPVMGTLRRGGPERLSAKEYGGTEQGAINRLDRMVLVISAQAMQDTGYMFAAHTQQFMTKQVWLKTLGDWPQEIMDQLEIQSDRVSIEPHMIDVEYDIIPRDSATSSGTNIETWMEIFKTVGQSEILLPSFNIVKIFKYIATLLGAKNLRQFENVQVQPKIAPDEQVAQQLQQGNVIPINQERSSGGAYSL